MEDFITSLYIYDKGLCSQQVGDFSSKEDCLYKEVAICPPAVTWFK